MAESLDEFSDFEKEILQLFDRSCASLLFLLESERHFKARMNKAFKWGAWIFVLSIIATILAVDVSFQGFYLNSGLYFNQNLWNLLAFLGIALVSVSFVLEQLMHASIESWSKRGREIYKEHEEMRGMLPKERQEKILNAFFKSSKYKKLKAEMEKK